MSATYRPKDTVEHRVVDFVHALSAFLGLLWWFFGCLRDWTWRGTLEAAIFAATWKNQTLNSKKSKLTPYMSTTVWKHTFQSLSAYQQNWHTSFTTDHKDPLNMFFSWAMFLVVGQLKNTSGLRKRRLHLQKPNCLTLRKLHKYCENCTSKV